MPLNDLKSQYDSKQLKQGPRKKGYKLLTNYYESHNHDPHHTFFYGFLSLIYDGINLIDELKAKMRIFFISSSRQVVIEEEDVEEFLQKARRNRLIKIQPNNKFILTEQGVNLVEYSYFWNLHTSYWMRKFFSKSTVLIGTAVFLVIMSLLKILTGIDLGSQGMITEGYENLTDLIKIGIIVFVGMRLKRDKLASIIIILLMLFTGGTLAWSSVEALINPVDIIPTVQ
ncbi:MAG: hypothetical protein ACFE9Z_01220 [Promethearchaeota archaeon]